MVADYVHDRGVGRGFGRLVYDAAQLESLSVWRILGEAFLKRMTGGLDTRPQSTGLTLITKQVEELRYRVCASDPASKSTVAPGKSLQARALAVVGDYYDPMGYADDPQIVAPLLSQPLIETVLRIPSYVLTQGGWDRGLARQAFLEDLPIQIARRRGKGGIDEYMMDLLRFNLSFLRSFLLDGLLVEKNLLDATKLSEALSDRPSDILVGTAEIFWYTNMEAWLRLWQQRDHQEDHRRW
jgi:asparagine synthase (glutamine-hydrolysing)